MTGLVIVAVAAALALAIGLYRKASDGRVREATDRGDRLDGSVLGSALGATATFVQFSASVCAPCRATSRLLGDVTSVRSGVNHVELDAEQRFDLVERYGITRTPTVLLVDGHGVVRSRIVGAPRESDVLAALRELGTEDADQLTSVPRFTGRG